MKCQTIRKMVSQYLDEELTPDDRRSFELHIDGCLSCSRELEEHMAVRNLFASSERFEAPVGFSTQVVARLRGTEEMWLARLWRLLTARPLFIRTVEAAFALAVMLIGMYSGGLLVADRKPERQATVEELFSLDLFRSTPPGSIGGVYVSLTRGDQ